MQKIGCGSAIKVNFIALALHYLCRKKKLKTFRKDEVDTSYIMPYICFFWIIRMGNNVFVANYNIHERR